MFDFFDTSGHPPVGEHYETEGKHYFIVMRVKAFMGAFLAVEVDGPEDKAVFGKPLHLICHLPTREKEKAEQEVRLRAQRTDSFLSAVRRSVTHEQWWCTRFSGGCGTSCPANIRCTRDLLYEEVLDALCEPHREMVDRYLVEHPDAWPPGA